MGWLRPLLPGESALESPLNIVLASDSRGSLVGPKIASRRPGDTVHGTSGETVVGNATAQTFIDDYETRIAPLWDPDATNVVLLLVGLIEVNDGIGVVPPVLSAEEAYDLQVTLVALLMSEGWHVVVCTAPDCGEYDNIPPGDVNSSATPGNREPVRLDLDEMLRTGRAGAMACLDLAVVPELSNAYDTDFFDGDTIHLANGGQEAFADAADAKFDDLVA